MSEENKYEVKNEENTLDNVPDGMVLAENSRESIYCMCIVGQIEGHQLLPSTSKSTKYEHVMPLLAMVEESDEVDGLLVLLNRTVLNGKIFEGAALLMVILPPPYVIPVFADEPSERNQIASALSAMTLLTMILFAVCAVTVNL